MYQQLQQYAQYRCDFLNGTECTVPNDIGIIEKYLAAHGIQSDIRAYKPFQLFLAKLPILYPKKSNTKRAFRASELHMIFKAMPPTSFDTIILRCLIAFAVGGALRASEYTAPIKNPGRHQRVNIVKKGRIFRFKDDNGKNSMIYLFFRSKKNQTYQTEFAVMPCLCDISLPCAFHEILRLESHIKQAHDDTYLFVWSDKTFVTYRDTLWSFKRAAQMVGSDWKTIGTHSARKARVVIGVKQGLSEPALLLLGRWKRLDSVKPYLRMGPLDLSSVLSSNAILPG